MDVSLYEKISEDIRLNMTADEFNKIRHEVKRMPFLRDTELPASLYQLFIINDDKHGGLTQKQIWRIENVLKNALKYFFNIKVFMVVSTTSSENAHRVPKTIDGRQHTVVEGTKVPTHVHIGAIGSVSLSAKSYMYVVHERLKKLGIQSKFHSKGHKNWAMNYLDYCRRQADSLHQFGMLDFDFRKYMIKY